ncbi:MAG: signaling protein [Nocardioides sp.]|nr:signaling protein [Nocardioides sp.]
MSQRLIAAFIAVPAALGLILYAATARLPYATYAPGSTVDVLGTTDTDAPIVTVDGAETYEDGGQLRMTTVRVSEAAATGETPGLSLWDLMAVWFDGDNAVYPYDAVHAPDETPRSNEQEGAQQMADSQDYAVEVALSELGYDVPQVVKVAQVTPDSPSDGVLSENDVLRSVDGTDIGGDAQLRNLIQRRGVEGEPLEIGITRDGKDRTVEVVPTTTDGRLLIGILTGIDYDFPVDVSIAIDPRIGGPSAGLVFSLAVYDTLTPGSLTGGHDVAGTGEIYPDGTVGPIGGIQQKIAGARQDGAELFLVPEANCADALAADNNGDMRLMRASTMHEVRVALEAYAEDTDADLPSCEDAA